MTDTKSLTLVSKPTVDLDRIESEINAFVPPQVRDPLIKDSDTAAKSIEAAAAAVIADAKRYEEQCRSFAAELRRSSQELAEIGANKLKSMAEARKELESSRKRYLDAQHQWSASSRNGNGGV